MLQLSSSQIVDLQQAISYAIISPRQPQGGSADVNGSGNLPFRVMDCTKKKRRKCRMRNYLKYAVVLILMAALLALGGISCGEEEVTTSPTATPKEAYKVGALFASSGFNSTLGQTQKPTVEMLVDQINKAGGINGHLLEVIVYDTKSDTATAATLANKLIEDGVLAIIGPTSTGESMAVKPIANQAGVTLVSCAAGSVIVEPIGNYTWVFNTPQLDYVAIERLYIYLQEQSITKIALLTDTAGFGAAGRKWLVNQTLLAKYGLTIVADGDQTYGTSDVDMQAQLTKINGTDAQAIVCWGTNPGPAIVARNMKTLGMDIPLLCSHGIAFKSFIDTAGAAANGVIFCAGKLPIVDQLPDTDPQKALLEKYKTDFDAWYGSGIANTFGGHAYDSLMMVVDALKAVGPD